MTVHPATRNLDGIEVPAAGLWRIDPGHAEVSFVGRHFMLTKIRGRFVDVDAAVRISERAAESTIEATIGMASVSSGDDARDDHLRSADFFDVARFPTALFRSTSIEWSGRTGVVTGDLTIKDVTRPIALDVEYLGTVHDPWDNDRAVFAAEGRLDRRDWGLTWNVMLDSGGVLVSHEIALELHVELIRAE